MLHTKKLITFLGVFASIFCIGVFFYHVNSQNYIKQKEIDLNLVNHPEKIPTPTTAKISSFWFMNIMADIYWLRTIQYIWGNVISGEYKKYLSAMMDLITEMNPYFESPYTIWMLLIPSDEWAYDDTNNPENLKDYRDAEKLGIKWVENYCDSEKIEAIKSEDNLQKIISDQVYKNPCKSYKIPYYLAYVYYFYLKENTKAAQYYKIVSAQEDAPSGARVLAAIMQGKWGEREKSVYMFLSLAQSSSWENENCQALSLELQNAYTIIQSRDIPLSGEFIASIENARKTYLPIMTQENERELLDDTECTNFLSKAIREINLLYLEEADAKYTSDFPSEISAMTPEKLFEAGYINFIPTDYQQYEWDDYGIIYRYNKEIWRFDYEMWSIKK